MTTSRLGSCREVLIPSPFITINQKLNENIPLMHIEVNMLDELLQRMGLLQH